MTPPRAELHQESPIDGKALKTHLKKSMSWLLYNLYVRH